MQPSPSPDPGPAETIAASPQGPSAMLHPEAPIDWPGLLWSAGVVLAVLAAGLVLHRVGMAVLRRVAARAPSERGSRLATAAVGYARRPARLIIPLLLLQVVLPALVLPESAAEVLRHAVSLAMIAGWAWLTVSMSSLIEDVVGLKYRMDVADNLEARAIFTQVRVLRRTAVVIVVIIAAAVMLTTFPRVRDLGASLLASAGLAGLAVGFAARPVLQNLIAGVQIALTQPIRIDDVVIIEGEFGWIEEIASTFVVVRVWDQRRLVVPLNFFVEHTFQNWTRKSADLLGVVFLHVDYSVPVEELRAELRRIVEASGMWDGRVCVLQVVDSLEHCVRLRALVSAPGAGAAWDIRCHVREKMIGYLREKHPGSLPRVRAEVTPARELEQPVLLRVAGMGEGGAENGERGA